MSPVGTMPFGSSITALPSLVDILTFLFAF